MMPEQFEDDGQFENYWLRATFAAVFVLIYRLREFSLSSVVNRLQLRFKLKKLLLLYYKICPGSSNPVERSIKATTSTIFKDVTLYYASMSHSTGLLTWGLSAR